MIKQVQRIEITVLITVYNLTLYRNRPVGQISDGLSRRGMSFGTLVLFPAEEGELHHIH
jgi:hypothetical protein